MMGLGCPWFNMRASLRRGVKSSWPFRVRVVGRISSFEAICCPRSTMILFLVLHLGFYDVLALRAGARADVPVYNGYPAGVFAIAAAYLGLVLRSPATASEMKQNKCACVRAPTRNCHMSLPAVQIVPTLGS